MAMNESHLPELTPAPPAPPLPLVPIGDFARIVCVHDPERGPRTLLRLQHDVTDLAKVRQKLLLHLLGRAVGECERAVLDMSLSNIRLDLAKLEGHMERAKKNGTPTPQTAPPALPAP